MESDKLLNKASVEDLLKSLEDNNQQTIVDNPFIAFIQHFKLEAGQKPVYHKSLHRLFVNWIKHPIKIQQLNLNLSQYLPFIKSRKVYTINKDFIEIELLYQDYKKDKEKLNTMVIINRSKSIQKFFKHYGIEPGDNFVESYILYNYYDKWRYEILNKSIDMGLLSFGAHLRNYLKRKTTRRYDLYGVNRIEIFNNDNLARLRKEQEARNAKKEKQPKRKSKVSSNKSKV